MDESISVIVPVFNGEKSIKRCIHSILLSSFSNLEIILIDDGSTDNSGNLCDSLANEDDRVFVYHLKNSGVSKARNFGVSKAKGKYLAFIDCDDYITDDYFLELYKNITENQSDLAIGSIANVYGTKISYVYSQESVIKLTDKSKKNMQNFLELNQNYLLYGPVNKLYITNYIKKNNIIFPEDTSYGEDLLFNLSYMKCCNVISYKRRPVYFYDHSNEFSLSKKYREDLFENGLRLNLALKLFFEDISYFGEDEKKYIYRRVFDDAYNSIFNLWNDKCKLSFFEKVRRVNYILKNEEVCTACNIADINDYSKFYVFLIKHKKVFIMVLIREIMNSFHHK